MTTKIGILTKTRVAIATGSEQEIVWLQYSLRHLLQCDVELLDLREIDTLDTAAYEWLILDCCGTFIDRAFVEALLLKLRFKEGRVIVRLSSTRQFEGEIPGVSVLPGHAKSPEFAAIMRNAAA